MQHFKVIPSKRYFPGMDNTTASSFDLAICLGKNNADKPSLLIGWYY